MPVINFIDCKIEETIATYLFVLYMASKSIISSNISIFEDLNMNELGCDKSNFHFEEYLIFYKRKFKIKV